MSYRNNVLWLTVKNQFVNILACFSKILPIYSAITHRVFFVRLLSNGGPYFFLHSSSVLYCISHYLFTSTKLRLPFWFCVWHSSQNMRFGISPRFK